MASLPRRGTGSAWTYTLSGKEHSFEDLSGVDRVDAKMCNATFTISVRLCTCCPIYPGSKVK